MPKSDDAAGFAALRKELDDARAEFQKTALFNSPAANAYFDKLTALVDALADHSGAA